MHIISVTDFPLFCLKESSRRDLSEHVKFSFIKKMTLFPVAVTLITGIFHLFRISFSIFLSTVMHIISVTDFPLFCSNSARKCLILPVECLPQKSAGRIYPSLIYIVMKRILVFVLRQFTRCKS